MLSFVLASVTAATLTCGDVQKAYQSDLITAGSAAKCTTAVCLELREKQLRTTLATFAAEDTSGQSFAELEEEFDPIYEKVRWAGIELETVNVDLGDNSFLEFFWAGTAESTNIINADGSISIDGNSCDVEFEPYLGPTRLEKLCRLIVPEVQSKAPKSTFTMAACMSEVGESTALYVEEHDEKVVKVSASRNLSDVGAGYLGCEATIDRKSEVISDFTCDVSP